MKTIIDFYSLGMLCLKKVFMICEIKNMLSIYVSHSIVNINFNIRPNNIVILCFNCFIFFLDDYQHFSWTVCRKKRTILSINLGTIIKLSVYVWLCTILQTNLHECMLHLFRCVYFCNCKA